MRQMNTLGEVKLMLKPLISLWWCETDIQVLAEIQQLFVKTVVLHFVYYNLSELNGKKPVCLLPFNLKGQGSFQWVKFIWESNTLVTLSLKTTYIVCWGAFIVN